jgi:hypothetical protein
LALFTASRTLKNAELEFSSVQIAGMWLGLFDMLERKASVLAKPRSLSKDKV